MTLGILGLIAREYTPRWYRRIDGVENGDTISDDVGTPSFPMEAILKIPPNTDRTSKKRDPSIPGGIP